MSVFHPSARVRLTIRTEEFADTAALEGRLPPVASGQGPNAPAASTVPPPSPSVRTTQDAAAALKRNAAQLAQLQTQKPLLPAEEYEAKRSALIRERDGVRTASMFRASLARGVRPTSVVGVSPDELTVVGDISPLSATIQRNGLTTADTATITLNYVDAPFDPRVIRAAHVELVVGVVSAADYQAGAEGGVRRPDGSLVSQVASSADGAVIGATRFVGFVDNWAVKYGDEGDTVTLDCRDMSAPLRDLQLHTGESIDLSVPLDVGIQEFLNAVSPTTAGMAVRYAGEGEAPVPSEAAPKKRHPRRGQKKRRTKRGDVEMTLWDHITDVCGASGFIPQVKDYEVVIAEARTLFSTTGARRMVYGQNLEELSFTRRMQGVKVPTIEVRCYDSSIGRTRWARYPVRHGELDSGVFGISNPPQPLRANEVTPSGANPTEAIRVVTVSGIHDPETLKRVARNAFEQIGRQEIEGSFTTSDVSSYDRPPDEADLLLAEPGDPVELLIVSAAPPGTDGPSMTIAQLQAYTRMRRADYLRSLGWPDKVAQKFAQLQEASSFQTVFRVQDVRVDWDSDSGVHVAVNFINYITVREDGPVVRGGLFGAVLR